MRLMQRSRILLCLSLLSLAACNASPDQKAVGASAKDVTDNEAVPAPATTSVAPASTPLASSATAPASAGPLSCSAQIGAAAADRLAGACRNVSPATHPPCNVANSCAMMEDEIARSCALFDGQGSPMAECKPSPKSPEAAAAVVERYYSALNARDYDTAWQQWGEDGPPNQTMERFKAGFAKTRSTRVTIGKLGEGDAGAGSLYQPVPVTVDATLDDGTHQRFTGDYVVRRVNDVDGASPGQLRWHIDSARLKAVAAR